MRHGHRPPAYALAAALLVAPGAAAEQPESASVAVIVPGEAPSLAPGSIVVHVTGVLDAAAATRIVGVIDALPAHDTLILRLDSLGGSNAATERVVARLRAQKRAGVRLRTMVHQGDACASACLLVFMEGDDRDAGNASIWGFHGACEPGSNVPSAWATRLFLEDLAAGGVSQSFLADLSASCYLTEPGVYWLSGYELHTVHEAGIIQRLLPAWQPEHPRRAPSGLTPR